jgi:hypothetical protein
MNDRISASEAPAIQPAISPTHRRRVSSDGAIAHNPG